MGKLDKKTAIITGASSGIGKSAAILFASEGARVVAASRNRETGEATVREIKENGGEAIFIATDVTKPEDVERMVKTTVETFGSLHILYNNAGWVHDPMTTVDIPIEDWNKIIAINLTGTWLGMKYAIPEIIKSGGGAIINTASLAAKVGVVNQAAYSTTKGGIISLTKTAAVEYGKLGVRINCVAPGPVQTLLLEGFFGEEGVRALANLNPNRRLGRTEEVARVALFLACDDSAHMLGQTLAIDGGHTIDSHIS